MSASPQINKTSLHKGLMVGAIVLLVGGLGGGYALTNALAVPQAGASSNRWDNAGGSRELAYITDATETYLLGEGIDPDTQQMSGVVVRGNYAFGHLTNNDSGSIFFAQKTADVWKVVYSGQDIPPETATSLMEMGFPKTWIEAPGKVSVDADY